MYMKKETPLNHVLHLIGAFAWIACVQYFLIEQIVKNAWTIPAYSMRLNYISDLGATSCNYLAPGTMLMVCSSLHALMNYSFIANGLLIILGCVVFWRLLPKQRLLKIGLAFFGIGSLGLIAVGLIPENTFIVLHAASAILFFLLVNLGMILIGNGLLRLHRWRLRAWYSILSGVIALVALGILADSKLSFVLGVGLVERVASYPFTIWLVIIGISLLLPRKAQ
jgi:hypothetical membrane protein